MTHSHVAKPFMRLHGMCLSLLGAMIWSAQAHTPGLQLCPARCQFRACWLCWGRPAWLTLLLLSCTSSLCMQAQTRQALPCPKGTYKPGVDQATACTPCPNGLTAAGNTSKLQSDCAIAQTAAWYVTSTGAAAACPIGSYCNNGKTATSCPDGLTTQSTASTSAAACLAQPGYGYDSTATPKTARCVNGWYKVCHASLAPCRRFKVSCSLPVGHRS